jgi:hypothetical protein
MTKKPRTIVSVPLEHDVHKKLKTTAHKEDRSIQKVIVDAVIEYMKKRGHTFPSTAQPAMKVVRSNIVHIAHRSKPKK